MDWLVLIVVVPAVLVPLVLLFGFSGCGSFGTDSKPPAATSLPKPFDLVATAVGETRIDLVWKHPSAGGVTFTVALQGPTGLVDNHGATTALTFQSTGLTPGTTYFYRVRASAGGVESDPSEPVSAKTWMWKTAYDRPLTDNDSNFAGDCLVQRIDTNVLDYAGAVKQVRLTLAGSVNAAGNPLIVDQVSVSTAATPGMAGNPVPDAWDSEPPVRLLGPASLPGDGSAVQLPPVDLALVKSKDLVVAFDIGAASTSNTRRRTGPDVGASSGFSNLNAAEAAVENRSPTGWTARPGVYLVQKVEVLLTG